MRKKISISVDRTFQGLRLSAILGGQLVHRHYIGYRKKDALACFKQYLIILGE